MWGNKDAYTLAPFRRDHMTPTRRARQIGRELVDGAMAVAYYGWWTCVTILALAIALVTITSIMGWG